MMADEVGAGVAWLAITGAALALFDRAHDHTLVRTWRGRLARTWDRLTGHDTRHAAAEALTLAEQLVEQLSDLEQRLEARAPHLARRHEPERPRLNLNRAAEALQRLKAHADRRRIDRLEYLLSDIVMWAATQHGNTLEATSARTRAHLGDLEGATTPERALEEIASVIFHLTTLLEPIDATVDDLRRAIGQQYAEALITRPTAPDAEPEA